MPSRILAPDHIVSRRDFFIINTDDDRAGFPQVQMPIAGVEEMLMDFYQEGCFTRDENLTHMNALWNYHQTGEISRETFRLPRGMFHPYWRVIEQSGQCVMFHILVEACYQESRVPPPVNLFGEGHFDDMDMAEVNNEVHHSFVTFIQDIVDEEITDDSTAGAA